MSSTLPNQIQQLIDQDKAHLLHPVTSIAQLEAEGPEIMMSGQGNWIKDIQGQDYLDAAGGLWCVNIGYGRAEIGAAMAEACQQMGYYHSFSGASNPWQIKLATKLASLAPAKMQHVFFGNSGSDAVDTALKILWLYHAMKGEPTRRKIIARHQAYHGTTIGAASVTGMPAFHKGFDKGVKDVIHVTTPDYYRNHREGESEQDFTNRLLKEIEELISWEGARNFAGFIAEPIMGAGGVIMPPKGYFQGLQIILDHYDIPLIADEVICGFGRLGQQWGHYDYGMKPALLTSAKGLTSGYFPLSAVFIHDDIWQVLRQPSQELGFFAHGFTYSGHPVGAAAALKNIEILENEKLYQNAQKTGQVLQNTLKSGLLSHPNIADVRGKGLLCGLQLVKDKAQRVFFEPSEVAAIRVAEQARKRGVIVRALPSSDVLAISPPLSLSASEVPIILEAISEALHILQQ